MACVRPHGVEVEVRTLVPGDQGGSYEVKVVGPDGALVTSQDVPVGSAYGIEGVPFGWISAEATSGCAGRGELTAASPKMRMIVDGDKCILTE